MQHERIGIGSEFGNDKGNTLRHQPGDEGHVARQPVQLRDDDRALAGTCGGEGCSQLWPSVERIGALAGLYLDVLGGEFDAFRLGEAVMASLWVSIPRPDFRCRSVETR